MGRKVPIKLGKASLGLVHGCKGFRVQQHFKNYFFNNRFGNSIHRLAQQMCVWVPVVSRVQGSLSLFIY